MLLENRRQVHDLPYVWPSTSKEAILDTVVESKFNHIHLVGESGVGKSRLLYELLELFKRDKKKEIIDCSCYDERNKSLPILEVINGFTLPEKEINTFKNVYDLIEHHAKLKQIIIVIDDLHYEQDSINHFIEKVIYKFSNKNNISVTLITASRGEFPLTTGHDFQSIRLGRLSFEETSNLIKKECLKNETIKKFHLSLQQGSDGNPLYITEAINIIMQVEKDSFLKFNPSDFSNINNINGLYSLILSTFDKTQQQILKAASIVGKKFFLRDIALLLPEDQQSIEDNLQYLCEKNILIKTSTPHEYSFTHDQQLRNIYTNVKLNEKWGWHLTLAHQYKKLRQYELCGYHYYFSESYEESIKYLTFTARKALNRAQPAKAELFFKRAFEAFEISYLSHKKSYFKLQIDYCYLLLMQGRLADAEDIFFKLQSNSENNTDELLSLEINLKWMSGTHGKKFAVSLLNSLPKSPSFFTDRSRLIGILSDSGEHQESIKNNKALLNDLEKQNLWKDKSFASTKVACTVMLSIDYAALGNKDTAMKYIEENIRKINFMSDGSDKIYALTFTAEALHRVGKYKEASPLIKEAYELNIDFKIGVIHPHILARYAHNLAFFGDILKALELFDEGISFNKKNKYMSGVPYFKVLMAKAYSSICMDRVAIDILKNAEKIALEQQNDSHLALVYYELSLISLTVPDIAEEHLAINAKEYLSKSIHIAQHLNLKPLIDKCDKAYKCVL